MRRLVAEPVEQADAEPERSRAVLRAALDASQRFDPLDAELDGPGHGARLAAVDHGVHAESARILGSVNEHLERRGGRAGESAPNRAADAQLRVARGRL